MNTACTRLRWSWLILLFLSWAAQAQPAGSPAKTSLEGQWKGALTVPGGSLPLTLSVTELADGTRFANLDVPAQRINRALMSVDLRADTIVFDSQELGCTFVCQRSADGKELQGRWKQQGYQTLLTLQFVPQPAAPPKTFKFPPPYRVEEVAFSNSRDNARLSGTLTIPAGEGPFPAVVLLSDMGPQDRDASQGDYKLFGSLADYLTRRGIAVLRLDDRGVGQSTGDWSKATTALRATDAQVALNFLRNRPLIDFAQLGLIGHGEGGNIALLAAMQPVPPAFVVTLSASGSPGYDVMLQRPSLGFLKTGEADTTRVRLARIQLKQQQEMAQKLTELRAKGANSAQIETYVGQQQMRQRAAEKKQLDARQKRHRPLLETLVRTADDAQAQAALISLMQQQYPQLPAEAAQAQAAAMVSPWYREYMDFNPQTNLSKIRTAVLLLHGTADEQVPIAHLAQLEKGLKENRRVESRRLEGINHQYQAPVMEWPLINGEQKAVMSPMVQQTILDWIRRKIKE